MKCSRTGQKKCDLLNKIRIKQKNMNFHYINKAFFFKLMGTKIMNYD
jgi:hypothetical protein